MTWAEDSEAGESAGENVLVLRIANAEDRTSNLDYARQINLRLSFDFSP